MSDYLKAMVIAQNSKKIDKHTEFGQLKQWLEHDAHGHASKAVLR